MSLIAFTRAVPDALAACELTHQPRVPIDVGLARSQHEEYERILAALGCDVRRIAPAPHLADSVFVEDAAVVLDEVAVIGRPGAAARRDEVDAVAAALAPFRPITFLVAPATLDGGDVLRLDRALYVGTGARTNADGVRQLTEVGRLYGYEVRPAVVRGCLHLKSAVTEPEPGTVLVNPAWVDAEVFAGRRVIAVDPAEPHAANVLRVGDTVLCRAGFDRTMARLEAAGIAVQPVDVSELAKAEAGLTCCSLLVEVAAGAVRA